MIKQTKKNNQIRKNMLSALPLKLFTSNGNIIDSKNMRTTATNATQNKDWMIISAEKSYVLLRLFVKKTHIANISVMVNSNLFAHGWMSYRDYKYCKRKMTSFEILISTMIDNA